MDAKFNNILVGIGSMLVIMPSTDYASFVPRKTSQERLQNNFNRVGSRFYRAAQQINDAPETR